MTQHSKLNSLKTKILKDTPTFHSPRTPDELSYAPNDMSAQNPHTHQVFISTHQEQDRAKQNQSN